MFESEKALKKEESRTLWNTTVNAINKRPEKREQNVRRSLYTSKCKRVLKHLENVRRKLCAARTKTAVDVWQGWLAGLLH